MARNERLLPAGRNEGERLRRYYIPALYQAGHDLKLEINISDVVRWPVELAIKTGPAEFAKKLVTHRRRGGYLPSDCRISDGWQVFQGGERLAFADERAFIEWACGEWVEPRDRR
jgi:hypothetical protein